MVESSRTGCLEIADRLSWIRVGDPTGGDSIASERSGWRRPRSVRCAIGFVKSRGLG